MFYLFTFPMLLKAIRNLFDLCVYTVQKYKNLKITWFYKTKCNLIRIQAFKYCFIKV